MVEKGEGVCRGACALLVLLLAAGFMPAIAAGALPEEEAGSATAPLELTLRQCLELALANNLEIQVAGIDPQTAGTQVTLAWAPFDPSVYLSERSSQEDRLSYFGYQEVGTESSSLFATGYQQTFLTGGSLSLDLAAYANQTTQFFDSQSLTADSWYANASLSITQPLLKNFGVELNKRSIRIARNNLDISVEQFRGRVIGVLNVAQQAYWDLVHAIGYLEVQRTSLQRAEDFLALNRSKVEVGTLAPIEITTAEAEVAARELAIIEADHAVRSAKDSLRQVLNLAGSGGNWDADLLPSEQPAFSQLEVDWEECLEAALAARPDIRQARIGLRNRAITIDWRKNQLRPDLQLEAGYGRSGLDSDNFDETGTRLGSASLGRALRGVWNGDLSNWYLGASFGVPLGRREAHANFFAAKLDEERAEIEFQRLEQQAAVEVRGAVRLLQSSSQGVTAAEKSVELAQKKLEAEERRFENGLSTSYNVLLMQKDLMEQENTRLRAIVAFSKARLDLEAKQGTLLDYLGIDLAEE